MSMNVMELLPQLQQLKRADKLYIMQFLVSTLAEEHAELLKPDLNYPVWSPHEASEAADIMLGILEEHNNAGR